MKATLSVLVAVLLLIVAGFVCVNYYSFVFAKTVHGELTAVEQVNKDNSIISTGKDIPNAQLYSVAVAIKDDKGQIFTASSEDRRWAVAKVGQCAEARFFPYPFWDMEKSGTYFGARLVNLYDCKK